MKGAKWRALFCFIVALAAGCFAAACAEEHVHEYEAVVTPPTCTEQGYTTYTCPEDGESYVGDYVEPLGHTPAEAVKENVVDATCLGGGSYDLTIYCSVCGEELSRESVEVEKKDHTPETVPGKEATCTQAGLTEGSKCSVCGTVLKEQEEIPAKGHTPSEAKKENEKAATCTEAGSYDEVVYCSVCEKEISRKHVQTAALGHAWGSGAVTTAPTCSATGVRTYTCSRCDAKRTENIPMTAHTPVTVPGKAATCTETGLTDGSKCSVCGTVLKAQEEIPASGHSWGEWTQTKAPTCTTAGEEQRVCNNDPTHVETRVISASAHTWVESAEAEYLVSAATCEEKAVYYKSCSVCGAASTETFAYGDLAGHMSETIPGKAATCTETGLTEGSKCSVCGTVLKAQEVISASGHSWGEWTQTKAPTCTTAGEEQRVCNNDPTHVETQVISASGHSWGEWTQTKAPTCTAVGEEQRVCNNDPTHVETRVISASGHSWTESAEAEYLVSAATCTAKAVYYKSCSVCGAKGTETFEHGELADHTSETIPGKAATCTETGLTEGSKCSDCGTILKAQEVIPASGHSWGEWTQTKAPTCTTAGEEQRVCNNDPTHVETQVISASGHSWTESAEAEYLVSAATCEKRAVYYKSCSACGAASTETFEHGELAAHKSETLPGKDATCSAPGLTEGSVCSVCGEILVEQKEIPASAHSFVSNVCTACGGIDMSMPEKGSGSTVAVHDPSVIIAYVDNYGIVYPTKEDGRGLTKVYFVFGTQLAAAYSFDMESWVAFTPTFYEEGTTTVSADYYKVFRTVADWSGYTNSDSVFNNMWAPDIIYNPLLGKWCVYYSLSGDGNEIKQSSVFMMTSDTITGPYVYAGSVVYSGMTNNTSGAGNDDYEAVTGESSIPGRYLTGSAWNNEYGVHCIDPAVMYDEVGGLWLFYGSWSGGIALVKLDNETGLRDRSYQYGYTEFGSDGAVWEGTSLVYDPYMGIHIAGGWWVSGEGPYVEYIDGYYYLFMSYGGYAPDGGYNMRVFRSKDITGKYTDPNGTWAVYGERNGNNYGADVSHGLSFMQNYKWSWWTGPASLSQGHNSAVVDTDGNAYLVYHIKYDDGTIQHNVEVHRLVKAAEGEDSWYLVAPFQKSGYDRILTEATAGLVAGNWNVLIHRPIANYMGMQYNTDVVVTLNEDGTVSGAYTGNWSVKGQYITITLDDEGIFQGVLMEQQVEGIDGKQLTYTFTAMNESSLCIWGARFTDEMAAQLMADRITFPDTILGDLGFETHGLWGTTIAYSSSNTDVLANDGTFTAPAEDTNLTLTVTVSIGSASISKTKEFTIKGLSEDSIKQMLPNSIADDGYLVKAEPGAGGSIAPIGELSNYTGVSFTFRVKDVKTDWDVMFRTANGTQVYLSVLNYKNVNIFESAATLSEEGEQFLTENGYGETGFNHVIFLDEVEANQENGSVATISYNVDGSIAFYRNGVLMLTYAADTEIGTGTVSDLVRTMVAQVRTQGLSVVYPVSNVIVARAADYDASMVPPAREPIETLGTDNGDGTYKLTFGDWRQTQNVQGDFKVVYDINVKAPSASTSVWFNWVLKIGNDWALRADHYSGNINSSNFAQIAEVQYSAAMSPNYVNDYLDADVILTIQRTGVKVVVTADVTSLWTGDEFTYTATYANFGPDNTTVSLGGENCLINVYKVTVENGEGPVEPPHEHSFGEYADDVATCSCGATKVKYVVGSTTAEVIFESRENAEVVTNTDTSAGWDPWPSAMGVRSVNGDFAVQYTWSNTRDIYWYQDIILELTDGTNYLTKNFFVEGLVNVEKIPQLWTASDTATRSTTTTCNGEPATLPTQGSDFSFEGDYTASIVRIGSTLIITQTLVLTDGDVWKVVDVFTGFPVDDLSVQLTGNPFWVDDLRVTVGEMKTVGTVAMDEKLGAEDNSTAYTGNTPLWTSTIQQGQKITVTGTATSSGANVYNSPLAYLWTGNTASLNFRADNWVNGVDEGLDQSGTEANVAGFNFHITKTWQGFTPDSANGSYWVDSLVEHYKQSEFICTVTWDYTEANKIVVQYSFAWEDATFNQQYTITPQSGDLSESYSIGLGVDCAYYHVTGMTVE